MNIEQARRNMIEQQIRAWEVLNERVLDVLASVPREYFAPQRYRKLAFGDLEIPLGFGQFMMAPKVEGRMLQALSIEPNDRCLEIGTGSGFITACLARLGHEVDSVDIFADFTQSAQVRLAALGIGNVHLHTGDAARGWLCDQHFDVIAVTGSLPNYMPHFERQLEVGGRLFVIAGPRPARSAMRVTRTSAEDFLRVKLFETDLAPLLNIVQNSAFAL
jgi:protein-L-isoaspartate(D-aspartate) O-methyltransferase